VSGSSDPISVALLVASIFERLGVPYLIAGSVASTIHGEPRRNSSGASTADAVETRGLGET
jgi:hypothetical protein